MKWSERGEKADDAPANKAEKADVAAGAAVAERRHHYLLKALGHLGELGDQGPLYLIGATVVSVGAVRSNPRCISTGLGILAAVAIADLTKSVIKNHVTRSRPHHSVEENEYRFESGGSPRKEEQSFPSGHAACTVAASEAAIAFYPHTGKYLRPIALVMTVSRLAKGHHWPFDLLIGAAIGKMSQTMTRYLLRGAPQFISRIVRCAIWMPATISVVGMPG